VNIYLLNNETTFGFSSNSNNIVTLYACSNVIDKLHTSMYSVAHDVRIIVEFLYLI
jgi:hypothetical protein